MTTDLSSVIGDAFDKQEADSSLPVETKTEEVEETTPEVTDTQPAEVKDQSPKPDEVQKPKDDEPFTKIDRNSLPKELIPHFEKLNRDYLQAVERHAGRYRSQIAEREKELATLRQQLEANPKPQAVQTAPKGEQSPEVTVEAIKSQVTAELEEKHIAAQEEAVLSLDTRLVRSDDNPNFDKKLFYALVGDVEEQAQAYAEKYGSRLGFDYATTAKNFLQEWDESMRKETEVLAQAKSKEAKAKAEAARMRNPDGTFSQGTKPTGKMSFEDAFEKAASEHNVPF